MSTHTASHRSADVAPTTAVTGFASASSALNPAPSAVTSAAGAAYPDAATGASPAAIPTAIPADNTSFSIEFAGVGRDFTADAKRTAAKRTASKRTAAKRTAATGRGARAVPRETQSSPGAQSSPNAQSSLNVLQDVSLTVQAGEILAILGTSGCGKSTLLRIAGGLDRPTSGQVLIDGTPVSGIDPRCAVGFQEPRLLPWRTVADNIALGLPRGSGRASGQARVTELLELVGLADFAGHRPREISGGMAQRASLARALARNPGVLLLDEPFGALDALTRLKMQDLLLEVHQAAPTTVLLVTHDVDEALQLADRIILLGRPDATSAAGIRQEIVVPGHRPRDRGSAELAELRADLLAGLGIDRHNGA